MVAYFNSQAGTDLEKIGDHIVLHNPRHTATLIQKIRQHCARIAAVPRSYVARPYLDEAIRVCAHGNYLVVSEPAVGGALIVRVLHGARHLTGISAGQ